MIKMIHNLTGTEMWVADERKDEYLRAGHRLALPSAKPAEVSVEEPKEVIKGEPIKATSKRASRAKRK